MRPSCRTATPWLAALLLACAALTAPATARAEDKCLTGGSLLSDQRALTDLRSATEAACPCASYTGGAGLTRVAYQHCARDVLRASGSLREACKPVASKVNRGATCGSLKVACGKFAPSARSPLSCHLAATARCTSSARARQRACTSETHCADVVDWTASTCVDPRRQGPFAAGVRVVTFTKQSVVDPSRQRALDTVIWYPAPAASQPLNPQYQAVLDAPLDPSAGPYPLVMFSHGSCGSPTQSTFLWPLVASYGFIVVAPPHPGNTISELATCSTPQELVDSALERPQDIIFALDQMLAENADAASPFHAAIDASRIAMTGHSFGGYTTYRVVAQDARFKVALPMAPAVPGSPVLTIPSLHMMGQIDTYVDNNKIRATYTAAESPKYLVEIENAGHFAFSNLCFPSPDCQPPATLTQAEAHAAVVRWVLPFLERYLVGDTSFAPFLVPPPPPGAVLQAQP